MQIAGLNFFENYRQPFYSKERTMNNATSRVSGIFQFCPLFFLILVLGLSAVAQQTVTPNQNGQSPVAVPVTTPPLGQIIMQTSVPPAFNHEPGAIPIASAPSTNNNSGAAFIDNAMQTSAPNAASIATTFNFPGVSAISGVSPSDANGAVGATQYVQWVNSYFAIFNKSTGALLGGPYPGNLLFQNLGPNH